MLNSRKKTLIKSTFVASVDSITFTIFVCYGLFVSYCFENKFMDLGGGICTVLAIITSHTTSASVLMILFKFSF